MATSHHPILQENHQSKMSQTATGRRRSSKNIQKKKKPPQRGMGVEQLERLRLQDQIKNRAIHGGSSTHHQYFSNNFTTLSSLTDVNATATATATAVVDPGIYSHSILNSSPALHFPKLCVNPNNDFFLQQKVVNTGFIGSTATSTVPTGTAVAFGDQSHIDLYRFATSKPNPEKSKEIASMPNLFTSNNNSCFSDRCHSCNKKKRLINGDEMSIHVEEMIREKEYSGTNPLLQYPYSRQKSVEIVAIHRKGSPSAYEEEGIVMEYDFFPEKNESMRVMMSTNNSPESSSAGNIINGESSSVTTISWAADTITPATTSIDLSLKLSC